MRHAPGAFAGGLAQQGWRDTIDAAADADGGGYLRADGSNPAPPLADADTQAVAVAALRAARALTGDPAWTRGADALRALLSERYGPEVMALEAGDVVVPGAGSQLGWLLWADALEPEAALAAADRLCEPDILTAFGLRTLASSDPNFAAARLPPRRGLAVRLLARLGRAARARAARARPSGCGPACWRRSTGSAARPSCTPWSAMGRSRRSRSRTASRRGRSARAGARSTLGRAIAA